MSAGRFTLLLIAMSAFAVAVYLGLGSLRQSGTGPVRRPMEVRASAPIAGTIFLTQNGGLYRLRGDRFTELQPVGGGWTQPSATPDQKSLAIVKRSSDWSDILILDLDGHALRQLTRDRGRDVAGDHWAFYPTFSRDGATVYYSLDDPKDGFRVDLAIWAQPSSGGERAIQWTMPNPYTGGDVAPAELGSGGLIYSEFGFDDKSRVHSQLMVQTRPFGASRALTPPDANCGQPAPSPDGTRLAMICSPDGETASLVVAPFAGTGLGPSQLLVAGQLSTAPAWQPDGQGLAFLAPYGEAGKFQLWRVGITAAGAASGPPVRLTNGLDFDPASRLAWLPTP